MFQLQQVGQSCNGCDKCGSYMCKFYFILTFYENNRPHGITVYPYSFDRCLIWDATCVNTFASSNLIRAALAAGSVADAAEVRKIAKYAELGRRFIFQPVAVETSCAMGKSTIQFFKDLGRRVAVRFKDQRESYFLFQRVSLAILRGTPSAFCNRTVIRC